MSKQPVPPPPGNTPNRPAPPPPPGWRHWLWPIALLAALVLFLFLPRVGTPSVNLSYSAFLSDVSAHKIKTFTLDNSTGSTAPATGTLTNGDGYTTVIPLPFAGTPLQTSLDKANVQHQRGRPEQRAGHRAALLAHPAGPVHPGLLAGPADVPGRGRGRPAGRDHGRRPGPGQGVRR